MEPRVHELVETETTQQVQPTEEVPQKPKRNLLKILLVVVLLIVIVIGAAVAYFWKQSQTQQYIAETSPTPQLTSSPAPTSSVTDNWETYVSAKFHYTVKYPSDWIAHSIDPGPGEVTLNQNSKGFSVHPNIYESTSDAKVYFQIETDGSWNLANPTYEEYLKQAKKPYFQPTSIKELAFLDTTATVVEGDYDGYGYPAHLKVIHFPSKDQQTYFSITLFSTTDQNDNLNQILSTFKFTDETSLDTSNWKTYSDPKYGYTIKYPNEIYSRLTCPGDETEKFMLIPLDSSKQDPINMPTCARDSLYPLELTPAISQPIIPESNTEYKVSSENVVVGGINAKKYISTQIEPGQGPLWFVKVLVTNQGETYQFLYSGGCAYNPNADQDLCNKEFDQILSTFKFTN